MQSSHVRRWPRVGSYPCKRHALNTPKEINLDLQILMQFFLYMASLLLEGCKLTLENPVDRLSRQMLRPAKDKDGLGL